ncbi:MAG: GNAT family N-acetyltransferase [Acidobacteriota bacterium]|nr:GNAT family N-acetyltransferase [Acidobacteriota bacterium]
MSFDHKVFPEPDCFDADYWKECDAWWLIVSGVRIGCCAFEKTVSRTLYIATTGILPSYRGRGFGALMKSWQIAYAHRHKFRRLLAHTRQSNEAMIELNKQFGFRVVKTEKHHYSEPDEPALLMELRLG